MKIIFAATAPGNEPQDLPNRLLSYYLIKTRQLGCDQLFEHIKKQNQKETKS